VIKFSSLISVIQGAAEQAAHSVSQENFKLLKSYFHSAPSETTKNSADTSAPLAPSDFEQLTPRAVEMKFPKMTADGPQEHEVYVPLISLAPVSNMQMSELEIDMDMEIIEKDGEIVVGFPHHKNTLLGDGKVVTPKPNAKVKIKITPGHHVNGVTSIIEGYDKALRAQLPS